MSDNLQEIVERVKAGNRNETDIEALVAAIRDGKIVLVNAVRVVGVGGDVTDSQVVPGNKNVTGDCNIVIYEADAQTIQTVLSQHSSSAQSPAVTSIDELMQKVRSHCCEKIQNQYGKIRLLNVQQVEVDELYIEVYILDRPTNSVYAHVNDLLQESDLRNDFDRFGFKRRSNPRLQGLAVANRFSRLMILGKPGSNSQSIGYWN